MYIGHLRKYGTNQTLNCQIKDDSVFYGTSGNPRDCVGYGIRGSADYSYRWLLPAVLEAGYPLPCCRPVRICRWGCALENLRPVNRSSQRTDWRLVRMALINTRSIVNKTFILNDFFTSYSLDFLLLTETWLKPGENLPAEFLPPSCSFFSSLRVSGQGGGGTCCCVQ